MTFSSAHLLPQLPQTSESIWWIAFSGGLDSTVLLDALVSLRLSVDLRAVHINHQISPNAQSWEDFCSSFCAARDIPFITKKVDVANTGRGLEDAAREARYLTFEDIINTNDFLMTAHHADDQAETMLLRLMRGTGPRGLAAMAQQRPLGRGILWRPLLNFTRVQLEDYAKGRGLSWITDESNNQDAYDRNYLRNHIFPLLHERWPAFTRKWQQTADLCAVDENLAENLAEEDLRKADMRAAFVGTSIDADYFNALSKARRQNLIRYWLRNQGLSTPAQQHLQQIELQIVQARIDAETQVSWGNVSLRVYRQRIYALPLARLPEAISLTATFDLVNHLSKNFVFTLEYMESASHPLLKPDLRDLNVKFKQGGERCRPAGRPHSQTLKRLLQEYGVEPWLRDSLPLLYSGQTLVAVANLWICEGYVAEAGGYCLKYERILKSPAT